MFALIITRVMHVIRSDSRSGNRDGREVVSTMDYISGPFPSKSAGGKALQVALRSPHCVGAQLVTVKDLIRMIKLSDTSPDLERRIHGFIRLQIVDEWLGSQVQGQSARA